MNEFMADPYIINIRVCFVLIISNSGMSMYCCCSFSLLSDSSEAFKNAFAKRNDDLRFIFSIIPLLFSFNSSFQNNIVEFSFLNDHVNSQIHLHIG